MADPVRLDPREYQGTYKLIGGALALDFANLVSFRGTDRHHDWLDPASNVRRWAEAVGLSAGSRGDITDLLELRETLARVFLRLVDGGPPADADVRAIGEVALGALTKRRLQFPIGASEARWVPTAPSVLTAVAEDAATLLTSSEMLNRLAACDECRWLFLDTSRNRSRRWCDPADCGNRDRQRRHYRRKKQ